MEFSVNGKKNSSKLFPTSSSSLFHLHCYSQTNSISYVHFKSLCFLRNFTQIASFNRYEKVTCENCGTQTTKVNLARHKKKCSAGTLHCSQCPNLSTKITKMI